MRGHLPTSNSKKCGHTQYHAERPHGCALDASLLRYTLFLHQSLDNNINHNLSNARNKQNPHVPDRTS